MRDLIILVADAQMKAVFDAFFSRADWADQLGCRQIDLWPQEDIIFDALKARGYDGGVYARSQHVLNPFRATHRYAIAVLDQQFGGEQPAARTQRRLLRRLQRSWDNNRDVMVIDPELEVLLWQDHPTVDAALGCHQKTARQTLQERGEWSVDAPKPIAPKDSLRDLIERQDLKNTVTYRRIARSVPVVGCQDAAFLRLKARMQEWFPVGDRT
jgi:hypothetical protein